MPYYDYVCEKCGLEFEESLPIVDRDAPTEQPCRFPTCGGEVKQIIAAPYFGYDNIHTRHSTNNKEPGWFKDKITDLKRNNPGHSM